jgi:hypothetical protein
MSIETGGNLDNRVEEAEKVTERQYLEQEVTPEQMEEARRIILESLGMDNEVALDDFEEKLIEATQSLPRYKEIEQKLEGVDAENLPYELFKILKSDADTAELDPDVPQDGVLIKSMQQGHLECAGRTLIASTYLQSRNIEYTTIQAPGHTFLIIEQAGDTLVYFDANNNLYFTFPREALEGYQDISTTAECKLKEYTPRESDFYDGVGTVFDHFVVMPAQEGIGRVYLGNVGAALNGNKEFETSGIVENKALIPAVDKIKTSIYGENEVLDSFLSEDRMEVRDSEGNLIGGLLYDEENKKKNDAAIRTKFLRLHPHPTEEQFVNYFTDSLNGHLGTRMPFIQNTPDEQRVAYAKKLWEGFR